MIGKRTKTKPDGIGRKAGEKLTGAAAAAAAVVFSLGGLPVYAALDINSTLQKTLQLVFNLMAFGGIILTGYGVVLLAKAIASPDSSDPHGITRGISAIIGGVVMIAVQSVLSLLGVSISSFSLTS